MPYAIEWLMPQHVLVVKFGKHLSLDELPDYDAYMISVLDAAGDKKIHLLPDVTALEQFPNLLQSQQLSHLRHPNIGWVVVIGNTSPLMKTIGILLERLIGMRFQWSTSYDQALVFLRRMDDTLPENIEKS